MKPKISGLDALGMAVEGLTRRHIEMHEQVQQLADRLDTLEYNLGALLNQMAKRNERLAATLNRRRRKGAPE